MAHDLFASVLRGDVHLSDLFKWITNADPEENVNNGILKFGCPAAEFMSYFLNYLHEEARCTNRSDTPQKVYTPKSIKKVERHGEAHVKKRPALFPEAMNRLSHDFPSLPSKSNASEAAKAACEPKPGHDAKQSAMSTPKLMKMHSDAQDSSYMSPVSPLYSKAGSFHTPKSKRQSFEKVCLGDFIVQRKSSSKKKVQKGFADRTEGDADNCSNKRSRRINPTNLNHRKFNVNFQKSQNSFNFQSDFVELNVDDCNEQRNLLAEERLKIVGGKGSCDVIKVAAPKVANVCSLCEIRPDVHLVTCRKQLDLLIEIYDFLLNNNFIVNVVSELYFIFSLLLTKQYEEEFKVLDNSDSDVEMQCDEPTDASPLKTVHNCVYFSTALLARQMKTLQLFDRPTLKLMMENERIRSFSATLPHDLLAMYSQKSERCGQVLDNAQANVCFVSDTDNRENFPTDASFHAFRKQRDLFYEILRLWEQNHFVSGWNFSMALGGKIRSLLNLHHDPVNYRHFARLLKAQLLTSCRNYNSEEGVSESQMSVLSSIPNIDEDKLHRLKSRLVTKHVSNGINSVPTFTGHQEFYREFVLVSSTHVFSQHLRDTLVSEILLLNDTKFGGNELHDTDMTVDTPTRTSFLLCLNSLRLLAKFLGFIESLPYKVDHAAYSDKILLSEVETRRWLLSSFDLKEIIVGSIRGKSLTLTIPWISKYLAMLDYVTLRLPYYEQIYELLFYVYYKSNVDISGGAANGVSSGIFTALLVRLCLGWLFELPHFPSELYFNWLARRSGSLNSELAHLDIGHLVLREKSAVPGSGALQEASMDDLDIVDLKVLYACCPYLEEFKKLLASNSSNNGAVVKHITPLSAIESPKEVTQMKLKSQLEDAFFNAQPVSIRKTVEFICERVASICVKYICGSVVPDFKKKSVEEFKQSVKSLRPPDGKVDKKFHALLRTKSNEFLLQSLVKLQRGCEAEAADICSERVPILIGLLLSHEELQQTRDACRTIAARMCVERVHQWISSHVNAAIFTKDIDLEIHRATCGNVEKEAKAKPAFSLPPGGRGPDHNGKTLNAVKVLENVRKACLDVLDKKDKVTPDGLVGVLESAQRSIRERCDFNDSILFVVNKSLVDLLLLLLAHEIEIASQTTVLLKFVGHWREFSDRNEDLFRAIVCPRNVMLMAQSKNVKASWSIFTEFISLLLKHDVLSCEMFESQCITIYKSEWDEVTLKHLSNCFQGVVDGFVREGGSENKFTYLLSFISGYCSNMDVL